MPFRWREPSVGNLRGGKVEYREIGKSFQVHQPGIGDPIAPELEIREHGQPLQMVPAQVRHGRAGYPVSLAG